MPKISEKAMKVLQTLRAGEAPLVYRWAGHLARVVGGRAEVLTPPALKGILARGADFMRGKLAARPPNDVVADLLTLAEPPLPMLQGIATVPVVVAAGRIVREDGWDKESGLLLRLGTLAGRLTQMLLKF